MKEISDDWNSMMNTIGEWTGMKTHHLQYEHGDHVTEEYTWKHYAGIIAALLLLMALFNMMVYKLPFSTAINPVTAAQERARIKEERIRASTPVRYPSIKDAPNLSAANRFRQGNDSSSSAAASSSNSPKAPTSAASGGNVSGSTDSAGRVAHQPNRVNGQSPSLSSDYESENEYIFAESDQPGCGFSPKQNISNRRKLGDDRSNSANRKNSDIHDKAASVSKKIETIPYDQQENRNEKNGSSDYESEYDYEFDEGRNKESTAHRKLSVSEK
jgi:hypothetical protein